MADDVATAAHDEEEAPEESSSSDEDDINSSLRCIPSYPFNADFQLEFKRSRIEAIRHLGQQHPAGTRSIAIFFPGVHGGVGPCRQPPQNYDDNALFPTVARRLTDDPDAGVDCYRCSWPFMRPKMSYAVGGACRVLHHALLEAMKGSSGDGEIRKIDVFFVGHSLGGAVAIRAAEVVARHFGTDGAGGQQLPGLERAAVRVTGVCTLNGALDISQMQGGDPFASLSGSRALLVSGDADEVVPPEATRQLYEALPTENKRHLALPGGTHDLFSHKEQLIPELVSFIAPPEPG